jgi:hypothetical protein
VHAIRFFSIGIAALQCVAAVRGGDSLALVFVPNHGQAHRDVRFLAKGSRLNAYFSSRKAVFQMSGASLAIEFIGATGPRLLETTGPTSGEVNFLVGPKEAWRTGVPLLDGVVYRELYPGIDMIYRGSGPHIKSEFIVAPGEDPARIRLRYGGADLRVESDGSLSIRAGQHTLRESTPVIYQERDGTRVAVQGGYELNQDIVSFVVGGYDRSLPLVIDPVLSYLTLLGGSGADAAMSMAIDSTGAAYIAGFTSSSDFPTASPEQTLNGGGNEVFVAKLNPAGNGLVYCTYIGGRADDRAYGIAVDASGAAYVAGSTTSSNFPVSGALQPKLAGGKNAFVLKLNPAGNALVYSTYLGGNGSDVANGIAIDAAGNAYVALETTSTNLPVTGYQKSSRGGLDGFVAKIAANGSGLLYSTYLGGAGEDHVTGIAVDGAGSAFVTGSTYSPDFPLANAYQPALAGGQDAFVTKLSATGTSLIFSTYLGGGAGLLGSAEIAHGITVDAQGNVYVVGETSSIDFPIRAATQSTNAGWQDAFAAKFSGAGALIYSTYLGGVNLDIANAVAVDGSGNAYIAGQTTSSNLAAILGSPNPPTGIFDAFIVKLVPAGNAVSALVYLGGSGADTAAAIIVDASSNIYVAGWTLSPNLPVVNGFQTINGGNYSAFIGKLNLSASGVSVSVGPPAATLYASQTQQFTATVANASNTAVTWSVSPTVGTISTAGLYTAPASITTQQTVTATATSVADSSKSATATVTLYPPVAVNVTPPTSTLYSSQTQQFTATVANTSNTAVTWSVSPTVGTISSTGLYTAPASVTTQQTVTVRATSVADSTKSATASVNLSVPPPVLTSPANGNTALPLTTTLTWNVVTGASSYDVYFGSSSPPPLVANIASPASPATTVLYTLPLLAGSTTYYWRIVAKSASASNSSATWSFSTMALATALRFVPVVPCRVADTRNPTGPFGGPQIAGGATRSFTIPDSACGAPSTAQAYSLNVAAVPAGPLGYLTLWPAGQSKPLASTLNSFDGRIKSNAAIVAAGAGGAINVFASDATNVVLDINGYFVPAADPAGLAFYPVAPCRVADTRQAAALLGGPSLIGGRSRTFPIVSAAACSVPASAQAYSLNLAVVPKGPVGYLTAWPSGQTQPAVASLNALTGTVTANAAIVPAGSGGAIDIFASNATDLVIDINGYFAPATAGGLSLYTMPPCRALDTSKPSGTPPFTGQRDVPAGANCGIPSTAQAHVFSVTVVPSGALGYLTLWPQGQTKPTVSTLNALDAAVTSNLAIVPTLNRSISAFATDSTHLVLDMCGYFAP